MHTGISKSQPSVEEAENNPKEIINDVSHTPFIPSMTVNELLSFISNKMDLLANDVLVKVCSDFYTSNVIEAAKKDGI